MLKVDSLTAESPRKDVEAAIAELDRKARKAESGSRLAGENDDEPRWGRLRNEAAVLRQKQRFAQTLLKKAKK